MKMLIQHKIQAGFAVALAFLLLTGASAWWSLQRNVETFRAMDQTHEVIEQLDGTLVDLLNIQTGTRGFALSGDEAFLQPYQAGLATVETSLAAVKRLTQADPGQQRRLAALDPLMQRKLSFEREIITLRRSGDTAGAQQIIISGQGKQTMDEIRKRIAEIKAEEYLLHQQRTARAQASSRTTMAIVALAILLAFGLVGIASVMVRRDFEERQRAEAERDRFFTVSLDLLCIANTDGYFKRVNPAFTLTLGWSAEDILARPFIEFVHPDDRAATLREVEKLAAGQPTMHFEDRYQCKDGSWKWLSWHTVPQPDGTLYASARDITALKLAEDHLRRSEQEFRSMAEAMPQIVWATRPDGWNIFFNQQWVDYTGLTMEESHGHGWNKPFHPDDQQRASDAWQRATEHDERYSLECRLRHADGVYRWWLIRGAPMRGANGEVLKWFGTCTDIEESKQAEVALRRSEERLAVTLDSIGDAVLATDWEGRVTRLNPVAEKLTGWRQAEALGRPVAEVFHIINEETRELAVIPVEKVLATGEIHDLANHTVIIARDGTERPIADSAAPIRSKDGQILGVVLVFRDVTEGRHAAQKIEQLYRYYETLVGSVADGLHVLNLDGTISYENPAAERMLGYAKGELLGRPTHATIHHHDAAGEEYPVVQCPMDMTLRDGQNRTVRDEVFWRKDGTSFPVEYVVSPVTDAEGRRTGAVVVFRDETERFRQEKAIRASEERHRLLIHSSRDAMMTLEPPNWKCIGCNPATLELFGVKSEAEFCALGPWNLSPKTQPDGRASADMAGEAIEKAMREGSNYFEWMHQRQNDEPFPAIVLLSRLEQAGHPYLQATVRDITESKHAEAEARDFSAALEELVTQRTAEVREALATLDATEDGAFICAPDTMRFSFVNQGAVRQLGYTREELLGRTPWDITPEIDEAKFRELVAPMLRGETGAHRFTTLHRHKDGHDLTVEINLQYVTQVGGGRFIAIARDITERVKQERLALRSQRLESIGTLAGGVAHDVNNALAPIMMGLGLLKTRYPQESEMVDTLEISAQRGADMVRQLLTFAKGVEGELVSLQLDRLVKEIVKLMKGSFPKGLQLVVKCDPKLPPVLGDATQLHQVLLNLCVNARDAMPQGGTLTLEAQRMEVDAVLASSVSDAKPGKYVALRVRDTGTGIPPEILDRIFDPFFTTKGPDKGTGLGLSTVAGIVRSHGGFLQVYSQPGQGATFTAYLPVASESSDPEPLTEAPVVFRGQNETILFVDDEPTLRHIARVVLRRLNFNPLTATDGTDGVMQAAQHRTELRAVITDLDMPHMDGLAFVRALRQMLPDLPIVVSSGGMDAAVAGEFRTLGVTNYLDKPFTEVQLAEALRTSMSSK